MTSRVPIWVAAVAFCSPAPPAFAGLVSGQADFYSSYSVASGIPNTCDPSTGVCSYETQADTFNFHSSRSFSGNWSANANYDPSTGTYVPGWVGAPAGTQVSIAGSPTSTHAPPAFSTTTFTAAARSDIGNNGVSASIADGFEGNHPADVGRSTYSTVISYWTETVTLGGGTGTGTANVIIEITGDLQADFGDPLSMDYAQLLYEFNVRAFDRNSSYIDYPLSALRYAAGGAREAPGIDSDYCNGTSSPDCSGSFVEGLAGDVTFHYGQPVQFSGSLTAYVYGTASVTALNSARVTATVVPVGTTFTYESQALGNPLNITLVPEPQSYLMLLAGLGLLGLIARRRLLV